MSNQHQIKTDHQEIIGLLPAGGKATRIAPIPCSKEIYPVGFQQLGSENTLRPKVACHYLLEKYRLAGVSKTYVILRHGKWDIPAYLGDGSMLDMNLAYLMMRLPFGTPYTLDQAYPFVKDALIVFGFPDILFEPNDAFVQLLSRQASTQADIVLGLFPANNSQKADMVDLDDKGQVRRIIIKPAKTHLRYSWIIAVWTPVFTQFLQEYVASGQTGKIRDNESNELLDREVYMGDVIQAAIDIGIPVDTLLFSDGSYLDIGSPECLIKAIRHGSRP